MPPTPERGSWPADLAAAPERFPARDDLWWEADDYPYADDHRDQASAYLDPWDADSAGMDQAPTQGGHRGFGAYDDLGHSPHINGHRQENGHARLNGSRQVNGSHQVNGAVSEPGDAVARDYDDYFDDDEDDLDGVNTTSEVTRNALEWAVVLVGAVLVALLLRASLFQAFWIPSESMETTLLTNDRVLVNKVSYRLHDINRGDIVVFERPDDEPGAIRDLIKRVIALPGETVEATDGSVYINGQRLDEPYLDPGVTTEDFPPTVVPEGEVFVMGDNRGNSQDSRWFGSVSEERVVGRAFVLFWPVGRVGSL